LSAIDQFRGVIVPVVTPYREDKSVDYRGVEQIFDYFGRHPDVDGLFITGATGEYDRLDLDERHKIFDIAAKIDTDRFMVPNASTRRRDSTLELTKYVRDAGFGTVGIIIPEDCTTAEDVEAFFARLAKLEVSVFIYQTGNSPYPLTVDEFGKLLSFGNIVGIKDSCSPGAMTRHIGYISAYSDRINVIQGVEMLYLSSAVMGGVGVIGGGCNVYPSLLKRVEENLQCGDILEARRYQNLVNEFVEVIYLEGSGCESMRYYLFLEGLDLGCTSRRDDVVVSETKMQAMRDLHARLKEL
jgi:4-hydroxy-tetrahydrodipicolinate synthase